MGAFFSARVFINGQEKRGKQREAEDTTARDVQGVGQAPGQDGAPGSQGACGAASWAGPLDSGLQAWKAWAEEPAASAASEGIGEQPKGGRHPQGPCPVSAASESLLGRVARIGLSTSCTRMLRPWAPQTPTVPGWVARASAGMRDGGDARGRARPLRPRVGAPRALAAGAAAAVPEGAVCHVLTEIVGAGPARSGSAAV